MTRTLTLLAASTLFAFGCTGSDLVAPTEAESINANPTVNMSANAGTSACWGQASAVFARTGVMGQHASQEPTPRAGLRNLARTLYMYGIIPDDTMAALGAFVADALGLSIDACMA